MSRFEVGQRVVCVDNIRPCGTPYTKYLKLGGVYTIREINCSWPEGAPAKLRWRGPPWVRLAGIFRNAPWDCPFAEPRFEPLEPKHQSIEVFREILVSPPAKVLEDA